jgi:hypothetical protein
MRTLDECCKKYRNVSDIPVAECQDCTLWKLPTSSSHRCDVGEDILHGKEFGVGVE